MRSVKDHYTGTALRKRIVKSLRGPTVDLIHCLAPQARVEQILKAWNNVQNSHFFQCTNAEFYRMQQNKGEKVPMYFTRLEGALNLVKSNNHRV